MATLSPVPVEWATVGANGFSPWALLDIVRGSITTEVSERGALVRSISAEYFSNTIPLGTLVLRAAGVVFYPRLFTRRKQGAGYVIKFQGVDAAGTMEYSKFGLTFILPSGQDANAWVGAWANNVLVFPWGSNWQTSAATLGGEVTIEAGTTVRAGLDAVMLASGRSPIEVLNDAVLYSPLLAAPPAGLLLDDGIFDLEVMLNLAQPSRVGVRSTVTGQTVFAETARGLPYVSTQYLSQPLPNPQTQLLLAEHESRSRFRNNVRYHTLRRTLPHEHLRITDGVAELEITVARVSLDLVDGVCNVVASSGAPVWGGGF